MDGIVEIITHQLGHIPGIQQQLETLHHAFDILVSMSRPYYEADYAKLKDQAPLLLDDLFSQLSNPTKPKKKNREIIQLYRKLSLKHHPDKSTHPDKIKIFQAISAAYQQNDLEALQRLDQDITTIRSCRSYRYQPWMLYAFRPDIRWYDSDLIRDHRVEISYIIDRIMDLKDQILVVMAELDQHPDKFKKIACVPYYHPRDQSPSQARGSQAQSPEFVRFDDLMDQIKRLYKQIEQTNKRYFETKIFVPILQIDDFIQIF